MTFPAIKQEESTPATSHRVFVRAYAPWCGWAPVTEFNHAGHFGHRASVGIDERSAVSKVNVVWQCNGQVVKASRSISGVQWSGIEELEAGAFPSITQHVCGACTDPPCVVFTSGSSAPYALTFNSNFFRPTSQLAEGVTPKDFSPGILFDVTRGGAVKLDSLVIGPWRKGALQGDLWVESASFSILRSTAREPLTFSTDTLDFSEWLGTASAIVPPDAERIQGKVKISVRGFSVRGPGIPASLRIFTTHLSVENGVNQLVRSIALSDLLKFRGRDTAFFATISIPALPLRGKTVHLRQRLIGQDEDQPPAWSELVSVDSAVAAAAGGVAGISKTEGLLSGMPTVFALHANYPNPFNPSTTIRFDMPESGFVRLEVFDLLGRKVLSLAEGYREAGYHSVVWDATSYASGIYLARFTVTDARASLKFSRVMKLLLTK